jgi:exodeoxyribonuclease III
MIIATYNVNGVNGRLPVLLRWLAERKPDIVCLQELKAPDEKFPIGAIEAAVNGVLVGGLYLPNGNPRPGPKFEYKLRWFARLTERMAELYTTKAPVVIAGDYNVMPTERDVYKPERWLDDALFAPEVRAAFSGLLAQGWTDALRKLHPDETIYTFFDYFRNAFARNAGLRIDHLLLNKPATKRLLRAGVDLAVRGWEKTSDHCPVWIDLKE